MYALSMFVFALVRAFWWLLGFLVCFYVFGFCYFGFAVDSRCLFAEKKFSGFLAILGNDTIAVVVFFIGLTLNNICLLYAVFKSIW